MRRNNYVLCGEAAVHAMAGSYLYRVGIYATAELMSSYLFIASAVAWIMASYYTLNRRMA